MVRCYPYYVREFECEIQRQVKLVYGLLHLNLDLLVCVPMVLSCLVKDLDNKGLIEDSDIKDFRTFNSLVSNFVMLNNLYVFDMNSRRKFSEEKMYYGSV